MNTQMQILQIGYQSEKLLAAVFIYAAPVRGLKLAHKAERGPAASGSPVSRCTGHFHSVKALERAHQTVRS